MPALKRFILACLAGMMFSTPANSFANDFVVINKVEPNIVNPGQSLATLHRIDFQFDLTFQSPGNETVGALISRNVSNNHWDCYDPKNFDVIVNPGLHQAAIHLPVKEISYLHAQNCSQAFGPDVAKNARLIVFSRWHSLVGKVTVQLLHLQDPQGNPLKEVGSATDAAPIQWPWSLLTVSAQTAQNETLLDKSVSNKTIYQFPISSTITMIPTSRGGLYVDTKDLFATNERDSKSSFQGGFGFQYGVTDIWSFPLKIEEDMIGNQVASNLASQTSLQVSTTPLWNDHVKVGKDGPAWNSPPTVTVALPYTHRINQYVAPSATLLPQDDFAVNPGVALTKERLLEIGGDGASTPPKLLLYWEADLGMYYLPLETTVGGTKRAEGTGDASLLIPLSNFGIVPGFILDPTTQVSEMQIRIKYQDTVDSTNNYTRTKGWTFGLELSVK